jgi:excisionase family DNA binding protein
MPVMHNLTQGSVERGDEITVAQAAELIGVDRSTVTRWITRGRLVPTRKLPGRTGATLVALADVQALATPAVA